ncbi:hypothetical protein A1O3_00354 [Capronia epimyces CBS 606.96]|uniref:Uncharacterized protein n=1 Tax=Capronia epimyces CBS 606.96 TaxID=1182542 RepID=W9ZB88_9EURO|nr:uncharacterized protein A1O3_00354 [Capronia epimyces CBS 606.96]EXJ91804.1 hypothetical protein A1O3_00354 [Capronia epimyces CBS 606.96]
MATSKFLQDLVRNRPPLTPDDYLEARLAASLAADQDHGFVELLVETRQESEPFVHGSDSTYGSFPEQVTRSPAGSSPAPSVLPLMVIYDKAGLRRRLMRNSISPLSIHHELLICLVETCHISLRLLDFIICFGPKNGETRLTPPSIWASPTVYAAEGNEDDALQDFESAYIVRFPELHHRSESTPWSMRQFLIYHRLPHNRGAGTVIFAGIGKVAEKALEDYLMSYGNPRWLNAWEIHFVLLSCVVTTWRPYLAYLSEEITTQADGAIVADLDGEEVELSHFDERQYLKQLEDAVEEAISLLIHIRDTAETMRAMMRRHRKYTAESTALKGHAILDRGFQDMVRNLEHYEAQAKTLQRKVRSASDLVSSILDLSNSTALKNLAVASAQENAGMHELTKKATQDAAAVKVLTILTLIYLPATVISNFFSTSFVNMATRSDGSSFVVVASNWWILVATAVPLTGITIYVWKFYVQKEIDGQYPTWWQVVCRQSTRVLRTASRPRRQRDDGTWRLE